MEILSTLFDKYKNLRPPHDAVRSSVAEVMQNTLGVRIEKSDITVKRNVVYLSVDPHIKQEIVFHKKILLSKLKKQLGKEAPNGIV